jgi:N-acetylneuraminic acid mutarotase
MKGGPVKLTLLVGSFAILAVALGASELRLAWRNGKRMPVTAAVSGAMSPRGFVVAGGTSWQNGVKRWLRDARLYEPETDRWTELPSLPEPLGVASAVAVGDEVWVLGGSGGESTSERVYTLKPGAQQAWQSGPALPKPRVYAAAEAIGSRIYLACGSSDVQSTVGSADLWVLDTGARAARWRSLASLPGHVRTLAGMVAVGGKLYLFGGYTDLAPGKPANLADAWSYDPAADRWERLPDLPVGNRYMGLAAPDSKTVLLLGGAVTVPGGPDRITDTVWVYRIDRKEYAVVSKLPSVNAGMVFGRAGNRLVGIGGEPAGKTREDAVWLASF